jgi:hypothetical protein
MNFFDLYVQYANSEGFGLPQVEAAACGVPVCGTDYSAMESEIRKLGGKPITPSALYKELETGCLRAVPDNDLAADVFLEFFEKLTDEQRRQLSINTRKNFEKHYQWDMSGKKWEHIFDTLEVPPLEQTWLSQPKIFQPEQKMPQEEYSRLDPAYLARWLIANVLRDPSKLNTFFEARLTRDLTYRTSTASTGGMYFNESSAAFEGSNSRSPFDFNVAYNQMLFLCNRRNSWEQRRIETMRNKGLIK